MDPAAKDEVVCPPAAWVVKESAVPDVEAGTPSPLLMVLFEVTVGLDKSGVPGYTVNPSVKPESV